MLQLMYIVNIDINGDIGNRQFLLSKTIQQESLLKFCVFILFRFGAPTKVIRLLTQ